MFKMKKKANVFNYLSAGMIGIAGFLFILLMVILLISTVKGTSIVSGDANATSAVNQIMTAVMLVPQFSQIIIIAVIFTALLALVVMGGMWGYHKMKGQ